MKNADNFDQSDDFKTEHQNNIYYRVGREKINKKIVRDLLRGPRRQRTISRLHAGHDLFDL